MLNRRQALAAGLTALVALGGCSPTEPDDPPPETRTPPPSTPTTSPANGGLTVVEQGFSILLEDESVGYQLSYAAVLENTSTTDATVAGTIEIGWYDANGALLRMGGTSDVLDAEDYGTVPRVPPGERTAVAGTFFVLGQPATMKVTPEQTYWRPAKELPDLGALAATNVVLTRAPDEHEDSTVGFTLDAAKRGPDRAAAVVLLRDAAGSLLGGAATELADLLDTMTYTVELDTDHIPDATADANTEVVLSATAG